MSQSPPVVSLDEHRWQGQLVGGAEGSRIGFLLRLSLSTVDHAVVGFGEASPLPEFGHDDVELARRELEELDASALEAAARTADPFDAVCDITRAMKSPSARNAVETCVLDTSSQLAGIPMWRLLSGGTPPATLPASAVVSLYEDGFVAQAKHHLENGIRTLKLKCGKNATHELRHLEELLDLAQELSEPLHLRFDPNAGWRFNQARTFLEKFRRMNRSDRVILDWIEDPTPNPFEWVQLSDCAAVAADEVLVGREADASLLDAIRPDVAILKPMALGGFTTCFGWMALADERDMQVCVSHLFDGPVALDSATHLAFAISASLAEKASGLAPGLGLHVGLNGWEQPPRWAQANHLSQPR